MPEYNIYNYDFIRDYLRQKGGFTSAQLQNIDLLNEVGDTVLAPKAIQYNWVRNALYSNTSKRDRLSSIISRLNREIERKEVNITKEKLNYRLRQFSNLLNRLPTFPSSEEQAYALATDKEIDLLTDIRDNLTKEGKIKAPGIREALVTGLREGFTLTSYLGRDRNELIKEINESSDPDIKALFPDGVTDDMIEDQSFISSTVELTGNLLGMAPEFMLISTATGGLAIPAILSRGFKGRKILASTVKLMENSKTARVILQQINKLWQSGLTFEGHALARKFLTDEEYTPGEGFITGVMLGALSPELGVGAGRLSKLAKEYLIPPAITTSIFSGLDIAKGHKVTPEMIAQQYLAFTLQHAPTHLAYGYTRAGRAQKALEKEAYKYYKIIGQTDKQARQSAAETISYEKKRLEDLKWMELFDHPDKKRKNDIEQKVPNLDNDTKPKEQETTRGVEEPPAPFIEYRDPIERDKLLDSPFGLHSEDVSLKARASILRFFERAEEQGVKIGLDKQKEMINSLYTDAINSKDGKEFVDRVRENVLTDPEQALDTSDLLKAYNTIKYTVKFGHVGQINSKVFNLNTGEFYDKWDAKQTKSRDISARAPEGDMLGILPEHLANYFNKVDYVKIKNHWKTIDELSDADIYNIIAKAWEKGKLPFFHREANAYYYFTDVHPQLDSRRTEFDNWFSKLDKGTQKLIDRQGEAFIKRLTKNLSKEEAQRFHDVYLKNTFLYLKDIFGESNITPTFKETKREAPIKTKEREAPIKTEGGFENRGKGTPEGDGKDKAMRKVANAAIVELASNRPSSSKTTLDKLGNPTKDSKIIMLARNGLLIGKPLKEETKKAILKAHQAGSSFVVGDMLSVDSQFVDYLQEIGADFTIYYTGKKSKITPIVTKGAPAKWFNRFWEYVNSGYYQKFIRDLQKAKSPSEIKKINKQIREIYVNKLQQSFPELGKIKLQPDNSTLKVENEQILKNIEPTFTRLMVGNHGVYIEFDKPKNKGKFIKQRLQYKEYRKNKAKLYAQEKTVNYADYKPNKWYVDIYQAFNKPTPKLKDYLQESRITLTAETILELQNAPLGDILKLTKRMQIPSATGKVSETAFFLGIKDIEIQDNMALLNTAIIPDSRMIEETDGKSYLRNDVFDRVITSLGEDPKTINVIKWFGHYNHPRLGAVGIKTAVWRMTSEMEVKAKKKGIHYYVHDSAAKYSGERGRKVFQMPINAFRTKFVVGEGERELHLFRQMIYITNNKKLRAILDKQTNAFLNEIAEAISSPEKFNKWLKDKVFRQEDDIDNWEDHIYNISEGVSSVDKMLKAFDYSSLLTQTPIAKPAIMKAINNYIRKRTMQPRFKGSVAVIGGRPKKYKKVLNDEGIIVPWEYKKKFRLKIGDYVVSMRSPLENKAGVRALKIQGFTDKRDRAGNTVHLSPQNMKYFGGADNDIDKLGLYFNLPKSYIDELLSNKDYLSKEISKIDRVLAKKAKKSGIESLFNPYKSIAQGKNNLSARKAIARVASLDRVLRLLKKHDNPFLKDITQEHIDKVLLKWKRLSVDASKYGGIDEWPIVYRNILEELGIENIKKFGKNADVVATKDLFSKIYGRDFENDRQWSWDESSLAIDNYFSNKKPESLHEAAILNYRKVMDAVDNHLSLLQYIDADRWEWLQKNRWEGFRAKGYTHIGKALQSVGINDYEDINKIKNKKQMVRVSNALHKAVNNMKPKGFLLEKIQNKITREINTLTRNIELAYRDGDTRAVDDLTGKREKLKDSLPMRLARLERSAEEENYMLFRDEVFRFLKDTNELFANDIYDKASENLLQSYRDYSEAETSTITINHKKVPLINYLRYLESKAEEAQKLWTANKLDKAQELIEKHSNMDYNRYFQIALLGSVRGSTTESVKDRVLKIGWLKNYVDADIMGALGARANYYFDMVKSNKWEDSKPLPKNIETSEEILAKKVKEEKERNDKIFEERLNLQRQEEHKKSVLEYFMYTKKTPANLRLKEKFLQMKDGKFMSSSDIIKFISLHTNRYGKFLNLDKHPLTPKEVEALLKRVDEYKDSQQFLSSDKWSQFLLKVSMPSAIANATPVTKRFYRDISHLISNVERIEDQYRNYFSVIEETFMDKKELKEVTQKQFMAYVISGGKRKPDDKITINRFNNAWYGGESYTLNNPKEGSLKWLSNRMWDGVLEGLYYRYRNLGKDDKEARKRVEFAKKRWYNKFYWPGFVEDLDQLLYEKAFNIVNNEKASKKLNEFIKVGSLIHKKLSVDEQIKRYKSDFRKVWHTALRDNMSYTQREKEKFMVNKFLRDLENEGVKYGESDLEGWNNFFNYWKVLTDDILGYTGKVRDIKLGSRDGKWFIQYYDWNGKAHEKPIEASNEKEAKAIVKKFTIKYKHRANISKYMTSTIINLAFVKFLGWKPRSSVRNYSQRVLPVLAVGGIRSWRKSSEWMEKNAKYAREVFERAGLGFGLAHGEVELIEHSLRDEIWLAESQKRVEELQAEGKHLEATKEHWKNSIEKFLEWGMKSSAKVAQAGAKMRRIKNTDKPPAWASFQGVEIGNRRRSFIAGFAPVFEKEFNRFRSMGLSEAESKERAEEIAMEAGKNMVIMTQFDYHTYAKPAALRGNKKRMWLMFKTFSWNYYKFNKDIIKDAYKAATGQYGTEEDLRRAARLMFVHTIPRALAAITSLNFAYYFTDDAYQFLKDLYDLITGQDDEYSFYGTNPLSIAAGATAGNFIDLGFVATGLDDGDFMRSLGRASPIPSSLFDLAKTINNTWTSSDKIYNYYRWGQLIGLPPRTYKEKNVEAKRFLY